MAKPLRVNDNRKHVLNPKTEAQLYTIHDAILKAIQVTIRKEISVEQIESWKLTAWYQEISKHIVYELRAYLTGNIIESKKGNVSYETPETRWGYILYGILPKRFRKYVKMYKWNIPVTAEQVVKICPHADISWNKSPTAHIKWLEYDIQSRGIANEREGVQGQGEDAQGNDGESIRSGAGPKAGPSSDD